MAARYFTLEEANELLPQIASSMERALQIHGLLRGALAQLGQAGVQVSADVLTGETMVRAPAEIERLIVHARMLYTSLQDEMGAIEALGAEVKDVESGLVDFHSFLDGTEEVLLCWRIGEARIEHYHGLTTGFAGRKPTAGHSFVAAPSASPD